MAQKIEIFNSSSIKFLPILKVKNVVQKCLKNFEIDDIELNIIYLDNLDIQKINKDFLDHDYPTDVISFNIEENPKVAEIYIGAEIAKIQAMEYDVSMTNEICRLAVHGCLHICGFDDKTDAEKEKMTFFENKFLSGN